MTAAPYHDLDVELRRIAFVRALRAVDPAGLPILAVRLHAYAAAGLTVSLDDLREDAEALRRLRLLLEHAAPPRPSHLHGAAA